jgi:hypothetical protein
LRNRTKESSITKHSRPSLTNTNIRRRKWRRFPKIQFPESPTSLHRLLLGWTSRWTRHSAFAQTSSKWRGNFTLLSLSPFFKPYYSTCYLTLNCSF